MTTHRKTMSNPQLEVKPLFEKIRESLVNLDAYPKTLEDFRIKTFGGATVTIISIVLIIILFMLELHHYLTPYVQEELLVDLSNGKKLKINFDMTFPSCHLSLDATDVSGEQHINIRHDLFKRRLNEHGDPIELPQKDNTIVTKKSSKKISSNQNGLDDAIVTTTLDPNRCESCYGVEATIKKCCNTCQDVREAYNAKGWVFDPAHVEQCKREGIISINNSSKEGCQLFGSIEVNKIAGNFHIALGQSFEKHHVHVHDINLGELISMNTSHRINHLSFGQKVHTIENQLDGVWFVSEQGHGLATFQYYIKIIPTIYQDLKNQQIETNQFAVTRFKKEYGSTLDAITDARLPGVFFIYEFGPMLIKYSEQHRSTLHFLTSLCAIIGGILTGIIDSFIYHSHRALRAKIQLGKLG
ncbi:Endoplasmic reticulum-Golgi intermediate compartment protein 3 [Dermatophagoides farinae]|uniref:Endoplasmic reticulum-Golgi intermediate compartment protein 3 n=2 Tax=Dermatophagoides farinae TaxID=6954 RepID=A0A922HYY9_DERFA|nr:Endoplasmic reticulum-Golgi intermediate compartment protein 3 [Dermatophagoides farinae]